MMTCPYCQCRDRCGQERVNLPATVRSVEVYAAVHDLISRDRPMLALDPLYLAQELVYRGYFAANDPPTLVDVGTAQDLIREVER
jgi:hypothetical protein